ncbi:MAG: YHS domain-containing (seleno)protein [Pseudomonadota bacterium]
MRTFTSAVLIAATLSVFAPIAIAPATAQAGTSVPTSSTALRQNSWYGQATALDGTDVVSYFYDTGPVAGSADYTVQWDNSEWRFSSAANRDLFAADPEKFAPQFGGYCPVALSNGDVLVGSGQHHVVVDERLYFNLDEASSNLFKNETGRFIAEAKINF